mmetsp:Transcript_73068/g.169416  ORF Transcript_73068/g.169416 Transcript_73068/m.169416 type:complete len:207 (-) Transcript_73068:775-1395(-)
MWANSALTSGGASTWRPPASSLCSSDTCFPVRTRPRCGAVRALHAGVRARHKVTFTCWSSTTRRTTGRACTRIGTSSHARIGYTMPLPRTRSPCREGSSTGRSTSSRAIDQASGTSPSRPAESLSSTPCRTRSTRRTYCRAFRASLALTKGGACSYSSWPLACLPRSRPSCGRWQGVLPAPRRSARGPFCGFCYFPRSAQLQVPRC